MQYKYLLIALILPCSIIAQDGGRSVFSFINVEHSPRIEALGGSGIAIFDNDVSLSQTTPSLLNSSMHRELTFTFGDYVSDISLLSFCYARDLKKIGVLGIALKAINYGHFDKNDVAGYNYGSFVANDQVLTLGIGKKLNPYFSIGVNINFLNSNYDLYHSFALSSNISATYFNQKNKFSSTVLVKNIGKQLYAYSYEKESFPYEIQIAISKELEHLPFRYHLSYNNLNRFDIKSPYKLGAHTNINTGELETRNESVAKTALRHLVIGGELNPFKKSLFIRGGLNFQRRFDLTTETQPHFVGFSWGIGFRFFKYYFDYSRSSYHLAGVPNNFSITSNLSNFVF